MKRFAPVVPPKVMLQYSPEDRLHIFGDYHLLLAHDVIANPKAYQEAFAEILKSPTKTIIMDNSLIELGYALDPEALAAACHIIPSDYLVLPDKLGFAHDTARMSQEAADRLLSRGMNSVKFLGVVQGQTTGDHLTCAALLSKIPNIGALSIPRHTHKMVGTRVGVVQLVANMCNLPMHLLGFSEDLIDDMAAARSHRLVMGIDSAVPIRIVGCGVSMELPMKKIPPRPQAWWDTAVDTYLGDDRTERLCELEDNLTAVRGWLNHE